MWDGNAPLAVLDSLPSGICIYRVQNGVVRPEYRNPAFYKILGVSEEYIAVSKDKMTFAGVHADDRPALRKKMAALKNEGKAFQHTFRIWNEREGRYRYIAAEGSTAVATDGGRFFYALYSDVSEQIRLREELTAANSKMQDIVNSIPGGVAIYKVTDLFQTVYFSDGVPQLSGYTTAEYQQLIKADAAEMTYWEDTEMVVAKAREVIRTHEIAEFEFRKQHRDGHIVWVRVQIKWIGEEDGCPLLHCVFHNISDLKEAQLEMDHLINSIPGGIASYLVETERLVPLFFSDGVAALSGYSRQEYAQLVREDALGTIYSQDRQRVYDAVRSSAESGEVLDLSYRIRRKDGNLIWIHLNGRRMGPRSKSTRYYAVFTGMSAETKLFQSIANETADGIYVIDRQNYDLLYVNESRSLFLKDSSCIGQKCYQALHRQSAPCSFCTLKSHEPDGAEHEMMVDGSDRFYNTRFRETDWNGIPAYVKYVRDITDEVRTRREKERLEQYFQTVVKNLPGGVAVVRYEQNGRMRPEYLSDGFAVMTGMTLDEAWELYRDDAMAGVHPEDRETVCRQMDAYIESGDNHCEIVYRLQKGGGGYIWVKNTLSLIQNQGGESRVYTVYHDITREREEQEQLRLQYKDLIVRHYRTPGPGALIVGHCNITRGVILDVYDYTNSRLLETFGSDRDRFFTGISQFVEDEKERRDFLNIFLSRPALEAFAKGDLERRLRCFLHLPAESQGRYAEIKMNLVATPDSGDVTGILTVTDITEQTIAGRILHQLAATGYDLVADVDLAKDTYTLFTYRADAGRVSFGRGLHSERTAQMLQTRIVPRDQKRYRQALDPVYMENQLRECGPYTFSFSMSDDNGEIRTKNMTVSDIDLRLGRVCLARTDITDSFQEQQGLLNMIAYTFELAGFIDLSSGRLTMYSRKTVLENLPPYYLEDYDEAIQRFVGQYETDGGSEEIRRQFRTGTMLERLRQEPGGYDFIFSYGKEKRYKQVNVLWGDVNRRTVCLVRADVTDMLANERKTKEELESALALAKEASKAKSDFLSTMSHDIRTPMNAIMGMTTLAEAYAGDPERVKEYLRKISISSRHLLSLVNDILDMSKIEQASVTLNCIHMSIEELTKQLYDMMEPQARAVGVRFLMETAKISHPYFYADALRMNQILINLLGNAVKFTPEGGSVSFRTEEFDCQRQERVRYRFTVSDTGIGMTEEFQKHLFEPFARSQQSVRGRIEGTGLGLSIVKGLVERMDGVISVESREGKGSVFQVELEFERAEGGAGPMQASPSSQASKAQNQRALLAGRRFLVAEDNLINAEILKELMTLYDAQTDIQSDGAQAVQAFSRSPEGTYDAVLMDIQMPNMDGYQAAEAIRALERSDAARIPIIAMTANAFDEDVQRALRSGMNAHVAKPIDMDVLYASLSRLLKEHPRGRA